MASKPGFWDIIEIARKDHAAFDRLLKEMSEQELVDFYWKHQEKEEELHDAGMADHMDPPVSDDAMTDMAEWIVDQGVDFYDSVLEDLSLVPRRVPVGSLLDIRGHAGNVYQDRFGVDMRYPDEPPPTAAGKLRA